MKFTRPVKTIYEGRGVRGVTRAPKDVLQRVVDQLNAASDSRMRSRGMSPGRMAVEPRYTSNVQDAHAARLTGKTTRPRVVMRDGQAFLVLHRGVSSGGKQALSGSKYQGKWGDVAQAPGFPASTERRVAKKFAGPSPTELRRSRSAAIAKAKSNLEQGERLGYPKSLMSDQARIAAISRGSIKVSPDLKPSSRGKMRTKNPRPNVGTYLLPESEIKNAWVRPESFIGPEWEVRHPQVGGHLARVRKYFSAKLRLRELALGAGTRIRHIPLNERRAIAKKLREAFPGDPGSQTSGVAGLPRMIRTDAGGDMILSYRAASQKQRLVFPHSHLVGPLADPDAKELRKSKAGIKAAVNNRGHQLAPQDASIGTTTSRFFVGTFGVPYLGVYATPISKIPSRVEVGKAGFPNLNATKAGFNRHWEAEVAQPNGGNIIAVRESVGRNEVGGTPEGIKSQFGRRDRRRVSSREEEIVVPWGERGARDKFVDSLAKRNNKRLSAKLRLRELAAIL